MSLKPLLTYVSEVASGKEKLKPGRALSAFLKLSKDEKEEVRRFFSDVSERGQDVMLDFEEKYPLMAAEEAIHDVIGDVIDSVLSGDMADYLQMFKMNNN